MYEIILAEAGDWATTFVAFGGTGIAVYLGVLTLRWLWLLFWDVLNAERKHRY